VSAQDKYSLQERGRFKAWWDAARPLEGSAFPYEIAWAAWQAALPARPSPGGQDGLVQEALEYFERAGDAGDRQYVAAIRAALAARQPAGQTFQAGVAAWMGQCFLPSLYSNMTERGDRLLEEVLELLQAHNYDKTRVATLVDYVFGRPVGEPAQEVGGVMVTLAGYCWVAGLDMHAAGDAELARINQPEVMAKIRAKQEAKNALHFDTPLPGNATAPVPAQAVDLGPFREAVQEAYENADSGTLTKFSLEELLALIDSHSAGGQP